MTPNLWFCENACHRMGMWTTPGVDFSVGALGHGLSAWQGWRPPRATGRILTVAEHDVLGGQGAAVAEVLLEAGIPCRFRRPGLPDAYALIGPPTRLRRYYRLDDEGIAGAVRSMLD